MFFPRGTNVCMIKDARQNAGTGIVDQYVGGVAVGDEQPIVVGIPLPIPLFPCGRDRRRYGAHVVPATACKHHFAVPRTHSARLP